MALVQQIDTDLKDALRSGDAERLSVLRMLKSSLKNKEIAVGHELADDEALGVISKEVKQRRDAEAEYRKGNRPELADKEQREADLLSGYLPAQLSDDELVALVDQAIAETGASTIADMGKVMGIVVAKAQGKADGSRISQLVKQKLTA